MMYLEFIHSKGIPLSRINPGSDELALVPSDALTALGLLKNEGIPLVGGDVLSVDGQGVMYAYQDWGEQYHCLNWCCSRLPNESIQKYKLRSYEIGKKAIANAVGVAKTFNKKCLVVLVT